MNVYVFKINNDNYSFIMQRGWRNATPFYKSMNYKSFQFIFPEALLFENDKRREKRMAVEDCLTCRGTDPVRTLRF